MFGWRATVVNLSAALALFLASAGAASAAAQAPTITGNGWAALGIILGLIVAIIYFINGAITLSRHDDTSDEEDEGVGIFEGIEEDDPKPRRRR
jgi:hypothetical protein